MKNPKLETRNPKEIRSPKTGSCRTLGARDISRFNARFSLEPRTTFPAPAPGPARSGLKSALLICCLLASVLCVPDSAFAQNYSIDWHTIGGGGGTSTGGVYSVSGTIGQPDASTTTMTGGQFSLTGGFWSLIAIQTPGAPTLTIVPAGAGQATISWTPNTPGFVLQETPGLSPANWVNSASGTNNPVTVPVPGDSKFYRLFKP